MTRATVQPNVLNPQYCPAALLPAGCTRGNSCHLRHDIVRCTCGVILVKSAVHAHKQGKRHRALMLSEAQKNQAQASASASSASSAAKLLRVSSTNGAPQHLRKLLSTAHALEASAQDDKQGITVSHRDGLDFGVVGEDERVYIDVTIMRTKASGHARISLESITVRAARFTATLSGKSRWVTASEARTLSVQFRPGDTSPSAALPDGAYADVLELVFHDLVANARFLIVRTLQAVVGSREDHEQLKPKAPFTRRRRGMLPPAAPGADQRVIRVPRPPNWDTPNVWVGYLPEYKPPPALVEAAFGGPDPGSNSREVLQAVRRFLPDTFSVKTYADHFQVMLFIEDEHKRLELEMYALSGAEIVPNYPRYDLEVKGLEDGRPSVIVGDFIRVRQSGQDSGPWHEGRVHKIQQSRVSLHFGDAFNTYKGTKFDVRFVLNRLPVRRMHQAVRNRFRDARILFPRAEHVLRKTRVTEREKSELAPVNRLVAADPEQWETVVTIVNQPRGSAPFLVFGPPGTGKTVTVVEAIRQLLSRDPSIRILACAPSNSAADLLAMNLVGLGTTELFRLNALSRRYEDLPKPLQPFSAINDKRTFVLPTKERLEGYRVVVATCLSGGVPASLGVEKGHFGYIIVDEAGQATEPEVMLPIKSSADGRTNVILAGDNKQLGPIVQSPIASSLGLKVSYLARMMDREIYSLDGETPAAPGSGVGRGVTIVKLLRNFRSHPAILEYPNHEFYGGELQACGDAALIRSLENSSELPRKKFPIVFHGVAGKDDREGASPSYFNISEATVIKKYVGALISRDNRVRAEEIGVITPYHAQRCKIRELLRKDPKMAGITVASVEEFQGQERRVIIISTVRSSTGYLESDIRRALGFVASPQRFNVAVTRAQALLVVVGNPDVLSLDPLWRGFLGYVRDGGGWRGKAMPTEVDVDRRRRAAETETTQLIARLETMIVSKTDEDFDLDGFGTSESAVRWDAE
ncbi:unnamed protein product [Mycena citricolor]|uniref:RNA helicase n=2 Tax=Mycena citricolor TaxID=2018698 RepID=A0AAD2K0X8_9AGAR|nr:unnamed protein product [Mycena citricolor]